MKNVIEKLLDIARNELGYHEKHSNANLDDKLAPNDGTRNYQKYGRDLYSAGFFNGNKNGYDWCTQFAVWCFYKLCGSKELTEKVLCFDGPYAAGCVWAGRYYKAHNRFVTANYQPGDQMFFRDFAHTGIVEYVENGVVHTIEGNSSNRVERKQYSLTDRTIDGAGRPMWNLIPNDDNKSFIDVPANAWYKEAVDWAVENGIASGVGHNCFAPDKTCTRAEAMTMLWRMMGSPEPQNNYNPFIDVRPNDWFYKAVLWAVQQNITSGVDKTHFGPNKPCTRAQAVTFLWNASDAPDYSGNSMNDVWESDWFYKAVYWAIDKHITAGIYPGHFGPQEPCVRAMIVQMLYKMSKL